MHDTTNLLLVVTLTAVHVSARYCGTAAILSYEDLYEEPPCSTTVKQQQTFDGSIEYEGMRVGNLSYCCNANYTALVPRGTNLSVIDDEARTLAGRLDEFLSRYDCMQFYPFHTCELCREAYRTWVCALVFPMKCLGNRAAALQICSDVCLEVQRKCPPEIHFFCPLDDNTKDDGDGLYTPWRGGPEASLFGRGGCNPMHYNLGPGSPYTADARSQGTWWFTVGIAAWLAVAL
jgi:hypothetical protein